MKNSCIILLVILPPVLALAQEPPAQKIFFANSIMNDRYFYSAVSYTAPSWLFNIQSKLPVAAENFTPGNSLVLKFLSAPKGEWEARILYHDIRGIDHFENPTHLAFYLLLKGSEQYALPLIGIGEKDKPSAKFVALDQFLPKSKVNEWTRVSIPLISLGATSVSSINQITFRNNNNPDNIEHTILIDQIELTGEERTQVSKTIPELVSAKGYERHVDITWRPIDDPSVKYVKIYRSQDGGEFVPVAIQLPQINRYADFVNTVNAHFNYKITAIDYQYNESPFSKVMDASTYPMTDEQLLDMVQEANFRYYWEGAEPTSGLARENIPGRKNMIASGASGFGIMALIVGIERKFVSRDDAVKRFLVITSFLEKAEKFHGAFSHFINGPSAKAEPFFGERDNGGDLVETSFLLQGLLVAHGYFNADNENERKIRSAIDKIWNGVEWDWYRKTKDNPFLVWHWSPDKGWIINHKLIGWNETMITYFLAISSPRHGVPPSLYYTGWASKSKEAQQYRADWGNTMDGSVYTNGNAYYGVPLPVGVSNGGPLFFVHYSYLGLDPHQFKDAYTDYFTNNRNIARINYRYCVENPEGHAGYGIDCWGLSASDGPWHYSANEPVPLKDDGKMTPTGALASFPYTPDESMAALRNYYRNLGTFLWGEYGFRDAFNLEQGWCSEIFMGLNQGPIVVMIENYRSGLIWGLFMQNRDVKRAIEKIHVEKVR